MYAYAHTHISSAHSTSPLNLLNNYILFLNCFTIYMRTLHGNGQMNTNVFFKTSLTSETELTIPNTKHPFFITADASLIRLGTVLFQLNDQNKMKVISYNSRILNPQKQKLSTLDHELKFMNFLLLVLPIQYIFSPTTNLYYIVLQKRVILVPVSIELKCN